MRPNVENDSGSLSKGTLVHATTTFFMLKKNIFYFQSLNELLQSEMFGLELKSSYHSGLNRPLQQNVASGTCKHLLEFEKFVKIVMYKTSMLCQVMSGASRRIADECFSDKYLRVSMILQKVSKSLVVFLAEDNIDLAVFVILLWTSSSNYFIVDFATEFE
uniref:Uncharacterized protein n=1 Tax=Cucumis melo TaxID=3656 RepID=A0A9I9EKZ3_CUCME